mgnify:CR=1 FL=1
MSTRIKSLVIVLVLGFQFVWLPNCARASTQDPVPDWPSFGVGYSSDFFVSNAY